MLRFDTLSNTVSNTSTLSSYCQFLSPILSQPNITVAIGTFTFPFTVDDQRANCTFLCCIDSCERRLHGSIGWIRGDEKRSAPSGLGKPPSGRHYHTIMFTFANTPVWNRLPYVASLSWRLLVNRPGYAKVRDYNPDRGGLNYVLKSSVGPANEYSEWTPSENLDSFAPGYTPTNYHARRRMRRKMRGQQC